MAESRVNPQNFYVVQGWMVSDLGLKGNELAVCALVFQCIPFQSRTSKQQVQFVYCFESSRLDIVLNRCNIAVQLVKSRK